MKRFQSYIEKSDPSSLSVCEIDIAFPYGASLLEVLDQALKPVEDEQQLLSEPAHSPANLLAPSDQSCSHSDDAPKAPEQPANQNAGCKQVKRCLLPKLDPMYTGERSDGRVIEDSRLIPCIQVSRVTVRT